MSETQVELAQIRYLLPRREIYADAPPSEQRRGIAPREYRRNRDRRRSVSKISRLCSEKLERSTSRIAKHETTGRAVRVALVRYQRRKVSLMNLLSKSDVLPKTKKLRAGHHRP